MNRQPRLALLCVVAIALVGAGLVAFLAARRALPDNGVAFYVATTGNDGNPGTAAAPFATLARAQQALRTLRREGRPARVWVRQGTYRLGQPLVLTPEDSGTVSSPVAFSAYPGEQVTLSGNRLLDCHWRPFRDGILMCDLPVTDRGRLTFTQLFVNGKRQTLARYPNKDESRPGHSGYIHPLGRVPDTMVDPFGGVDDDMTFSGGAPRGILFDPASFTPRKWARPEEAVIHVFQAWEWGSLQWRIKGIDYPARAIWFGRGGFQMGAKWFDDPAMVDKDSRFFVENVFEELDAPGEWYLDQGAAILYYKPEPGMDMAGALVEAPVLEDLIRLVGSQQAPVHHITIEGFHLTGTASTFLDDYEVPSLGDWAIHRGGTVFLQGTRMCTIKRCWFDGVGGNAVFISQYNRNATVTGCKFTDTGDSAVCLVGNYLLTNGSQRAFPYECTVSNNLIHDCGTFGKQVAGIYISRAKRITAAHNTIYNMPRAGICIGDGTWGGHLIEFNHIHDTVRETGDHGPFNAWGRDRYLEPDPVSFRVQPEPEPRGRGRPRGRDGARGGAQQFLRGAFGVGARSGRRGLQLRNLQQHLKGRQHQASRRGLPHRLQQHLGRQHRGALLPRGQRRQPRSIRPEYHRHGPRRRLLRHRAAGAGPVARGGRPQLSVQQVRHLHGPDQPAAGRERPRGRVPPRRFRDVAVARVRPAFPRRRPPVRRRGEERLPGATRFACPAAWVQELRDGAVGHHGGVPGSLARHGVGPPEMRMSMRNLCVACLLLVGSLGVAACAAQPVKRVGMVIGVRPERLSAYRSLHADSNPGVRDLLSKYHMRNFSIYLRQLDDGKCYLFGYYEYTGADYAGDMTRLAAEPRNKAWLAVTDPMQIPLPGQTGWAPMEELYHLK